MQLNGLGRCKQIKVDMDYLRDKWKYVKGREQVVGNRPAYSPDMVEDVK
jgi:hypothetical protein